MNFGFLTHAHIYLFLRDQIERKQLVLEHHQLNMHHANHRSRGLPHIGLNPLFHTLRPEKSRNVRKEVRETKQFVAPDDMITLIGQQDDPGVRAALGLMYSCGMSPSAVARLDRRDFFPYRNGLCVYAARNLYFLAPAVKLLVQEWLSAAVDKRKPFKGLLQRLTPFTYVTKSFELRSEAQR